MTEHPADVDLVAYADDELDDRAASQVRHHLAGCLRCSAVLADLEPLVPVDRDRMVPFELPISISEVLGQAAHDDPKTNEIWHVEWDGAAMLVLVVNDEGERPVVAPVTFEEPTSPVATSVPVDANSLETPLHVWHRLSRDIPIGAFLAPVATVDPGAVAVPVSTGGHDAATAMFMATLISTLDRMEGAAFVEPALVPNAVPLPVLLEGFKPSELHKATGLELPTITAYKRGRLQPGLREAEVLAPLLGVRPDQLLGRLPLPNALVRAVQRPVHRIAIRARAAAERVGEAVARLNVAQAVAVMPARTSGGPRDVQAWDELVRQYLDE